MDKIKLQLKGLLCDSIKMLTKDKSKKYGLLFSGGIDSTLIALLLKEQRVNFTCFFAYIKDNNLSEAKDLLNAKAVAKKLKLKLEIISITKKEVPLLLSEIVPLIKNTSPITIGVALPTFVACRKAKEKGIDVIFSGLGSDELYAGYHKFKQSNDILKDTKNYLENLPKVDLPKDELIAKHLHLEIKYPFLNKKVVDFSLTINPKLLLSSSQNKIIIREVAKDLGLPEEFAERKKIACQYGSNSDKIIEKLSKENGYKNREGYLNTFLAKKNKIGALFSGGKDSNLSLWLMTKQNCEVSCLISLIPKNKDSYMFQTPEIKFLKLQSKAIDIPLLVTKTKGEKEEELIDLKKAISEAKKKYNLDGIVAGALYSNYQKNRVEKICIDLKLKLFAPLWHKKEEDEIKELLDNNFKFIICKIAGYGLSEKFLGKVIDAKDLEELKKLNQKYKISIAGEGGEYETLVLDAPNYKSKIKILDSKKIMQNEFTGHLLIKQAKLEKKYV